MPLVDALLAVNLILVTLCLVRGTHRQQPSIDSLLRQARVSAPPMPSITDARIVPFRTRAERELAQGRSMHPSAGLLH